jgi:hypothetical protein
MDSARRAAIVLLVLGLMTLGMGGLGIITFANVSMDEMLARPEFAHLQKQMASEQMRISSEQSRVIGYVVMGIVAAAGLLMMFVAWLLFRDGRRWAWLGITACAVFGGYVLLNVIGSLLMGGIGGAIFSLIPLTGFWLAFRWLLRARKEAPAYAPPRGLPPPMMGEMPPQQSPWQPGYGAPMAGYYWKPPANQSEPAADDRPPSDAVA